MDDQIDRPDAFDHLDAVPVPDQWESIIARAEAEGSLDTSPAAPRRRQALVLVGSVAAALLLIAGFFVVARLAGGAGDDVADVVRTPRDTNTANGTTSPTPVDDVPDVTNGTGTVASVETMECASAEDLAEIATLVRTGQPTYDYQPAQDVAQLTEWADVVVTGRITSVQRLTASGEVPAPGTDGLTTFELADVEVLSGEGTVEGIVSPSLWASGQDEDPMSKPIAFEEVEFIAFLRESSGRPGGWTPFVDGFAFQCAGADVGPIGQLNDGLNTTAGLSVGAIADEVRSIGESPAIARPVFPDDVCAPLSAQEFGPFDGGLASVFFPMDEVVPIQIVGRPGTTPADPFALVQRVTNWSGGMRGEVTAINGTEVGVATYDNFNGEAIWLLDDGTTGYLRSRGLDRTEIEQVVASLSQRPSDASIPGFAVTGGNAEFALLHEQMNTDVRGTGGAQSECQVESTGYIYRLSLVAGDPILQYAVVIDRPPPLDVRTLGDATIILTGPDEPTAPSLDQVVDADVERFGELLDRPDLAEQLATPPDVSIGVGTGEDVELNLVDAIGSGPESGPLLIQLVEEIDPSSGDVAAVFLQVDTSRITLHPDADVRVTFIDGSPTERGTASVGPVYGMRLTDGEPPEPFELSIRIVEGEPEDTAGDGDRILQITRTIRLVPE